MHEYFSDYSSIIDRPIIHQMKLDSRNSELGSFLSKCPTQYAQMLAAIDALTFNSTPDYNWFYKVMNEVYFYEITVGIILSETLQVRRMNGIQWCEKYDWECNLASGPSCGKKYVADTVGCSKAPNQN